MKYLCLIYSDEKAMGGMSKGDLDALMGAYFAFTEDIKKSGHYRSGEALQPVQTATSVRVRNGKLSTTDGPFAETKELVAGYTLIQVRSREEALEWTRRFPSPHPRDEVEIEVRQLFELDDFEPQEAIERFREIGVGGR